MLSVCPEKQHIQHLPLSLLSKQVTVVPYSGLFSRGVNFPEFPELTRDSGNFILDC